MSQKTTQEGAIYSVGYNAWTKQGGLPAMLDALEKEGVTIVIDTRNSDYKSKHRFEELAHETHRRTGGNGKPMRFAHRAALSDKPREEQEYTAEGFADYRVMNERPEAKHILDGMAHASRKGERIALLCSCADTCACHRTRWLARSLSRRGVDVGHIEPGEFDLERHQEEGIKEIYSVTRHQDLPELPPHSQVNWREQNQKYAKETEAPAEAPKTQPPPKDYHSPEATRPLPERPEQILIAGSIQANNAQLNYASALVIRAAEIGAQIHVGDNPNGVDARVVETANTLGYENVVVWTPDSKPRNGGVAGGQIRKVLHNPHDPRGGNRFTQRDRTMIGALDEDAGAAFFIDNGFTHYKNGRMTGTETGYTYAVQHGKAAQKVSFGRAQDRDAELKPLPAPSTQSAYSFHVMPLEGEACRAVVLRDTALGSSDKLTASHMTELREFREQGEAETYIASLETYLRETKPMPLSGTSEQTGAAATFLAQVAQKNGFSGEFHPVDRAVFEQAVILQITTEAELEM